MQCADTSSCMAGAVLTSASSRARRISRMGVLMLSAVSFPSFLTESQAFSRLRLRPSNMAEGRRRQVLPGLCSHETNP